ncbi:MAG: diaminopropionate ammonia-lyase [Candidatus Aminicenantes bacterium]|nr:diaminopropionate ammonia-lyase [Candidatus Aminicenantes bacterium]
MCETAFNELCRSRPEWTGEEYAFLSDRDMLEFHRSLPGYEPTPLRSLPALAARLGVGEIHVKDESVRFGIKAFKALGASYAMYRFLQKRWADLFAESFDPASFRDPAALEKLGLFTFCAATDGNHGRAVAWTARLLGQKAVIYMPADSVAARVENIRAEGAEVVLLEGTFDRCVERCAADAAHNGWQVVSDTAYPGYRDIPGWILMGYTTIFAELEGLLHGPMKTGADAVILPAGVGGLAAAGAFFYSRLYGPKRPCLICVEPLSSDCFLESVRHGKGEPLPTRGNQTSIMAGLNCGIPSPLAWPFLRDAFPFFLAVGDEWAERAMRQYYRPLKDDPRIISGESGSSGLAALLALATSEKLAEVRGQLPLGPDSRILLLNTEGDTDPENFRKVVEPS